MKGKSTLMIFDRHANLKYKYGRRQFWCEGYYVDTVTYFYGHYKFALFGCYDSSFIDELGYGFFSLDYSVKMC